METRLTYNCAHISQVNKGKSGGTGSVEGGTGWYLMVLGHYRVLCQYRAILVGT